MIKNVIAAVSLAVSFALADEPKPNAEADVKRDAPSLARNGDAPAPDQPGSTTVIGYTNILWNFHGTNKIGMTITTNLMTNWTAFSTNALTREIEHYGTVSTNRQIILHYGGKDTPANMDILGVLKEEKPTRFQKTKIPPARR